MMSARTFAIAMSCLLFFLFSSVSTTALAEDTERLEVRIRSTILNIRETTSTKSPIVDVLQQGDLLTVTTTGLADWIKLDDGRGFISIHYVDVLSRTPVIQSPAEEQEKALRSALEEQLTPQLPVIPEAPDAIISAPAIAEATLAEPNTTEPNVTEPNVTEPAIETTEVITQEQLTDSEPVEEPPISASAPEPRAAVLEIETQEKPEIAELAPAVETTPEAVASPEPVACSVGADNSELRVTSIATTCRKNLKTLYYEACEVTFNLELASSCDNPGEVLLTCSSVAQTTNLNQLEEVVEIEQEATIYLKDKTITKQRLLWMPTSSQQHITDIQLQQKLCALK